MEKEILNCFHGTILKHFDDPRAKVRRQAHSCASELLYLSHSMEKSRLLLLIPSQMEEFCHSILSSFYSNARKKESEAKKKQSQVRLMHLLSFLESSIASLHAKGRKRLGEDLLKLFLYVIKNDSANNSTQNSAMIGAAALAALMQIFDNDNQENPAVKLVEGEKSEEDVFCAQAWASLLKSSIELVACTKNSNDDSGSESRVLYVRAITTVTIRLLAEQSTTSREYAKLLPLSFDSIVNCLGDDVLPESAAQGICAELGRLIRSSAFKNLLLNSEMDKTVNSSIGAIQKLLHYRFRSNWDCTLPCLAALVVSIVTCMIPSEGAEEKTVTLMQSRVKPLTGGLVQLHGDVEDKGSLNAIENATSAIVEGTCIELFLGLVELGAPGGAISNDRAWILSVLKNSASTQFRPRMAFFDSFVLGLARRCDKASAAGNMTAVESSIQKSRVIDLWSLFPCFCVKPVDIGMTLPAVQGKLVMAMKDVRYPQLLVREINQVRTTFTT